MALSNTLFAGLSGLNVNQVKLNVVANNIANVNTVAFKSTRVETVDLAHWKVTGDLTIHGVARPVLLDTHYLGQAMHPFAKKIAAAFRAETAVDRHDFGVTWNAAMDTGGAYLGERVQISLSILALLQ